METEAAARLGNRANRAWERRRKARTGGSELRPVGRKPVTHSLTQEHAGGTCAVEVWQRTLVEAGPSRSSGRRRAVGARQE